MGYLTKYFCILPRDDIWHRDYLRKLVGFLQENPKICSVHSDVQGFGKKDPHIVQESICGDKYSRTEQFMRFQFNAVSLRAVVNKNILSDQLLLMENDHENFASDTVWVLQKAIKGEVIRIPEILYFKRYLDNSAHEKWQNWSIEKKVSAWIAHCGDCLLLIKKLFTVEEFNLLFDLCIDRLLQKDRILWKINFMPNEPDKRNPFLMREFIRIIQ